METKNIVVSAAVALLVVVLGFAYFGRPRVNNVSNVSVDEQGIIEKILNQIKNFGAFPGTSLNSEIITINGVDNYFYEQSMTSLANTGGTATGTVCVFKLPSASTTLVNYNAVITSAAPTTTSKFALYNTIGGYGTSSVKAIGGVSNIVSADGRLTATGTQATTTGVGVTGMFLRGSNGGSDNSFLIFDLEGGSFNGAGTCRIQLQEL